MVWQLASSQWDPLEGITWSETELYIGHHSNYTCTRQAVWLLTMSVVIILCSVQWSDENTRCIQFVGNCWNAQWTLSVLSCVVVCAVYARHASIHHIVVFVVLFVMEVYCQGFNVLILYFPNILSSLSSSVHLILSSCSHSSLTSPHPTLCPPLLGLAQCYECQRDHR